MVKINTSFVCRKILVIYLEERDWKKISSIKWARPLKKMAVQACMY